MELQFVPPARAVPRMPPLLMDKSYGRMHMVRHGFLYAGHMAELSSQRHSALLYVALSPSDGESEFGIETSQGSHHASAMLVAPGVQKRFLSSHVPVMCVDVCPTHRSYRALAQASAEVLVWPRKHFEGVLDAVQAFRDGSMSLSEADRLYARIVALAVERMPALKPIDPRVSTVMQLLREGRRRTLQELAAEVCVSKDWLVHLFQREAGISLRKYEQTLMLQTAATYVNRGVSMTEVAGIAGFADSAHFSKMWKQHYGFPPRRMFVGSKLVTVDPLPSPSCFERPAGTRAGRAS